MSTSFDREIGELRARMAAVETDLHDMRRDVREIRDALVGLRGGWRVLSLVVAISASFGAVASKALPLLIATGP
jgi:CHAD domain-containing protein